MVKAIREVGRVPVQRGTFYEPIRVRDDLSLEVIEEVTKESETLEGNLATA
jgi:hypothetical protein